MSSASQVRVMVVWCPDWPIVAARATGLLPPNAPGAIVDRGVVIACSAEARAGGVRRGLRLREAQTRCPDLVACADDPILAARVFEPLVAVIEERVPGVQLLRPGLCVVRARGAARYYNGEDRAANELLGAVKRLSTVERLSAVKRLSAATRFSALVAHDTRIGIADGIFAAEQAAYRTAEHQRTLIVPAGSSPEFLATLPIDALSIDAHGEPTLIPLLKRLGAHTLGDFAALNGTDVRTRFGEAGEAAHARAGGRDPRAVTARVAPRDLDRTVEFEPPLDRVDQVAFGFRTAADAFVAGITSAGLVCTAIRVVVDTESGAVSEREWAHPRHFTASEVLDRLRWQLQGSGGGLTSPITRVRVSPERVDAIGNHEAGLWGHAPDERIHHGLSRIQSMLGHDAVLTAVVGGGRMLAERRVLVPWGDAVPAAAVATAGRPWPGSLPDPPPATVFKTPQSVQVLDADKKPVAVDQRGALSAPPAWLRLAKSEHHITAWAGPWPVHQRWWDAARSRRACRFQLVDDGGEAWLVLQEQNQWRVEARYD